MAEIAGFHKPEISIFSGGTRFLYERIYFDSSGAGNVLELFFKDDPGIADGTILTGLFSWKLGRAADKFFSCAVDAVYPVKRGGFIVVAHALYHQFLRREVGPASWRSSNFYEIIEDILGTAGIDSFRLDAIENFDVPRFSVASGGSAREAIEGFFLMVAETMGRKPVFLSSPSGAFVCGFPEDVRTSIGDSSNEIGIAFEKGVNIIERNKKHITSFAYPVLFNQEVNIDEKIHLCTRSRISARPGLYRLRMEVEPI